jgi:aryl-alcohol dehydrogenase-like predicted oxidoreductase
VLALVLGERRRPAELACRFSSLSGASLRSSHRRCRQSPPVGRDTESVALAWLLQRSANILLIPGTSSTAHLRENIAGAGLVLSQDALTELDDISR